MAKQRKQLYWVELHDWLVNIRMILMIYNIWFLDYNNLLLIDVSKTFDRLCHHKLFEIIMQKRCVSFNFKIIE